MEQPGTRQGNRIEPTCPHCGVPRNRWVDEGVARQGTLYCCEGCANGTGCTCEHPPPASAQGSGGASA